jgi:MCP family monocarboxylic acid transporter-like MFS transporter 14
MAGTALGMLIMPQLVRILLEEFGFQGAVLLLSGVALHSLVGSTLLQPAKWHMKEEEVDIEMIECEYPALGAILEDDGDEDSLPEIQTLLFKSPKYEHLRDRKISETNSIGNNVVSNGVVSNGAVPISIPKRPTFPRITSSNSISTAIPKRPTFPRITSTVDMTPIIRSAHIKFFEL